jgi:hypothetical protein
MTEWPANAVDDRRAALRDRIRKMPDLPDE